MKIEHAGYTVTVPNLSDWHSQRAAASKHQRELMDDAARHGVITDGGGLRFEGLPLQRLRDRLLGTYSAMPEPRPLGGRPPQRKKRWLVQDVWRYGTMPMFGGNPKTGKSTLVIDLTSALLTPGRRFLDHFEVPDLAEHERDIYLINPETPVDDFEDEMEAQGLGYGSEVTVDHLEELGGAHVFDVTDPAKYDLWAHRFAFCESCDGTDDRTPFIVIVDGLTAILQAAGKGVEHYGLWYAAFRRLMRQVDVPSALVVGHNTLSGGHLMGGAEAQAGPDGLINYWSENPDRPASRRWLSVVPRMGGNPVGPLEVRLDAGRLRAVTGPGNRESAPMEPKDDTLDVALQVAAYVAEHPGAHGQELTDNVQTPSKGASLAGRARAVADGLVFEEPCNTNGCSACAAVGAKPHHRRLHYWPLADPPP